MAFNNCQRHDTFMCFRSICVVVFFRFLGNKSSLILRGSRIQTDIKDYTFYRIISQYFEV